jgi:hypothetical protein
MFDYDLCLNAVIIPTPPPMPTVAPTPHPTPSPSLSDILGMLDAAMLTALNGDAGAAEGMLSRACSLGTSFANTTDKYIVGIVACQLKFNLNNSFDISGVSQNTISDTPWDETLRIANANIGLINLYQSELANGDTLVAISDGVDAVTTAVRTIVDESQQDIFSFVDASFQQQTEKMQKGFQEVNNLVQVSIASVEATANLVMNVQRSVTQNTRMLQSIDAQVKLSSMKLDSLAQRTEMIIHNQHKYASEMRSTLGSMRSEIHAMNGALQARIAATQSVPKKKKCPFYNPICGMTLKSFANGAIKAIAVAGAAVVTAPLGGVGGFVVAGATASWDGPFRRLLRRLQELDDQHQRILSGQWTVTSGGAYCLLSTSTSGASCVQDTSGSHGNDEDCTFSFTGAATLVREEWGLEVNADCSYDYLQVNGGTKYCGGISSTNAFPSSMAVSGTTTFAFHSDRTDSGTGFKICTPTTPAPTATPTPAPTASPTPAPTASPVTTAAPTASPTATPTLTPTASPTLVPPHSRLNQLSEFQDVQAAYNDYVQLSWKLNQSQAMHDEGGEGIPPFIPNITVDIQSKYTMAFTAALVAEQNISQVDADQFATAVTSTVNYQNAWHQAAMQAQTATSLRAVEVLQTMKVACFTEDVPSVWCERATGVNNTAAEIIKSRMSILVYSTLKQLSQGVRTFKYLTQRPSAYQGIGFGLKLFEEGHRVDGSGNSPQLSADIGIQLQALVNGMTTEYNSEANLRATQGGKTTWSYFSFDKKDHPTEFTDFVASTNSSGATVGVPTFKFVMEPPSQSQFRGTQVRSMRAFLLPAPSAVTEVSLSLRKYGSEATFSSSGELMPFIRDIEPSSQGQSVLSAAQTYTTSYHVGGSHCSPTSEAAFTTTASAISLAGSHLPTTPYGEWQLSVAQSAFYDVPANLQDIQQVRIEFELEFFINDDIRFQPMFANDRSCPAQNPSGATQYCTIRCSSPPCPADESSTGAMCAATTMFYPSARIAGGGNKVEAGSASSNNSEPTSMVVVTTEVVAGVVACVAIIAAAVAFVARESRLKAQARNKNGPDYVEMTGRH